MHHPDFAEIVVLNDGETFSGAQGCTIQFVPDLMAADTDAIEDGLRDANFESEPAICASDVIEVAATLLEPNEIDFNPEYFRALIELCNGLRGRVADDIEQTETELRKAASER